LRNKGEYSEGDRGKYNIEVKGRANKLVKRRYILKMKLKLGFLRFVSPCIITVQFK